MNAPLSVPSALRGTLLVAVIIALMSCRSSSVVRIGLTGSLSDSLTISMKRAAAMAVDEINAGGGINGTPVELIERDDFGNADTAVRIANDLYNSDAVAVIGHSFSGPTIAAAPVYNSGRRPVSQISPSASSPDVSAAGPYTFRVCPSDLAHGSALARYAWTNLRLRRAAVLYNNNGYGRGIRRTFVDEFTRLGGQIVSVDPYLGDRPDVSPYIERLGKNPADFIVVAGYRSEAEEILRQARSHGINVPIMGGDGLEQIEQSGVLAEGVYLTAAYSPEIATPGNRRFVEAYTRRFPGGASPNQSAVGTYDALYLLARIIRQTGANRQQIRDALAKVGNEAPPYAGLTRSIAFDSAGDLADQRVFIGLVHNGHVLPAETQ